MLDGNLTPEGEQKIYQTWITNHCFESREGPGKGSFILPMPPPNITGQLHMGHALFLTLQDTLVRFHRMQGKTSLWIPGSDHAGIATQEKILEEMSAAGIEASRENFLATAAQWKQKYQARITEQMQAVGASCDWARYRYTLDESYSHAVIEAFNRASEKGLIYRKDNQWWMDMSALAGRATEALDSGALQIEPQEAGKTYRHFLDNIQPWCLSRQIWWGHRIPAWRDSQNNWWIARSYPEACSKAGTTDLEQDNDVLDTWFSSSLWPFAIQGWPEANEELKRFYPATMIETGGDILFFWCARMIMMGLLLTDQVPFGQIYLHGLIRDSKGRKMSKSLGNGIDPLVILQKFGTDSLRFALLENTIAGQDMKLSDEKFNSARRFTTKLRNAARFCLLNAGENPENREDLNSPVNADDQKILSLIEEHRRQIIAHLEQRNFHMAARELRIALKDEFCDWWIEAAKPRLKEGESQAARTGITCLRRLLRLAHPLLPFTSEEIWGHFNQTLLIEESI